MTTYSSNIKELRERLGLKQDELAAALGMNVSTLRNWESGGSGFDGIVKLYLLCKALKCDMGDIVTEHKE